MIDEELGQTNADPTGNNNNKSKQKTILVIVVGVLALLLVGFGVFNYLEQKEIESLDIPLYESESIIGRDDEAVLVEGEPIVDEAGELVLDADGEPINEVIQVYQEVITHEGNPDGIVDGELYGE